MVFLIPFLSFFISISNANIPVESIANKVVICYNQESQITINYKLQEKKKIDAKKRPQLNIELAIKYQDYIWKETQKAKIPYELFISLMYAESRFVEDCVNVNTNGTRDVGFLQINTVNHKSITTRLDVPIKQISEPYTNIDAGIMIFGDLLEKYHNENIALIAYNMGEGGMRRTMRSHSTTSYSRKVLGYKKTLRESGGIIE